MYVPKTPSDRKRKLNGWETGRGNVLILFLLEYWVTGVIKVCKDVQESDLKPTFWANEWEKVSPTYHK